MLWRWRADLLSGAHCGHPSSVLSPLAGSRANAAHALRIAAPIGTSAGSSGIPVVEAAVPKTTGSSDVWYEEPTLLM